MALKETVRSVASLMELAARTAPKAAGQDFIEAKVLSEQQRVKLGNDLVKLAKERNITSFERDGRNVLDSDAIVLIGLMPHRGAGLNCGGCGYETCEEFNKHSHDGDFHGPNCAIRMLDMGIALGSAAKVASDMNVDNRVMYRIGVSAKRLGMSKANIVHGIPLSASGKNIFFDRQPKK